MAALVRAGARRVSAMLNSAPAAGILGQPSKSSRALLPPRRRRRISGDRLQQHQSSSGGCGATGSSNNAMPSQDPSAPAAGSLVAWKPSSVPRQPQVKFIAIERMQYCSMLEAVEQIPENILKLDLRRHGLHGSWGGLKVYESESTAIDLSTFPKALQSIMDSLKPGPDPLVAKEQVKSYVADATKIVPKEDPKE